jgi:hypothetical protein
MSTTTTTLGLTKPALSAGDVWGDDINDNFDTIDTFAADTNTALSNLAAAAHTHTASAITNFDEAVDDRVNTLLVGGSNVSLDYNDSVNTLTINASGGGGGVSVPAYTITNVTTDRAMDANSTSIDEVADVLGTLIADLTAGGSGGSSATQYDTLTDFGAATISADILVVRTAGYTAIGDGGHGMYVRLAAAPSDPANNGYIRTVDRYTSSGSTDVTHGGYWGYVVPSEGIPIECFGGVADDVTDCIPALEAAEEYVTSSYNPALLEYKGGPKILFGYGRGTDGLLPYRFTTPYTPGRTVHLKGASAGGALANGGSATLIRVAAGQKAIILRGWTTGPTVNGATGSVFEDLNFQSQGFGGQTTAHGFDATTQFIMRNCEFSGFGGNGANITGNIGITSGNNVNLWKMEHVKFYRNYGDGLYIDGPDANAGISIAVDTGQNGGWAINDSSFLGNTHIAAHSAGNTAGAYKADDGNAANVFLGCYSESEVSSIIFPSMMIGGNAGAGATGTGFKIFQGNTLNGFRSVHNSDDADFTLDFHTTENEIFKLGLDSGGNYQTFSYRPSDGNYGWNSGAGDAFLITRSDTTLQAGRGTALTKGSFILPQGFWVGNAASSASPRYQSNGLAAPVSGTYARGDIIWNYEPAKAGNLAGGTGSAGWICTAGGTPGTWATFGHVPDDLSVVYDPPSLATGAVSPIQTINSNGLPAGSLVQASFSNDLQGVILNAWAVADNVKFQFYNPTAGAVDLASGTVRVRATSYA